MRALGEASLVLFFTNGASLQTWARSGILSREVELYKRLLSHVGEITFVTYGDSRELQYADQLDGIRVLCNRWGLPSHWYARLMPILHLPWLLRADILKTNQTSAALGAMPVQSWLRKKLITRCGYMWSVHMAKRYGEDSEDAANAFREEGRAFRAADRVIVTTEAMKGFAVGNHEIDKDKIRVVPNFVDTALFSPGGEEAKDENTICFIGRLDKQKNVMALVEAVSPLDITLLMIGEGPLRPELESRLSQTRADIRLLGRVEHSELPGYLRRSALFVLPSLWEGHPKALLEAMACGTPVIGGDSPGISELLTHGETGYVCPTTPVGIRDAIATLLAEAALRDRLGSKGRQFVVENFSLERVVDFELQVYESVMDGNGDA